MNRNGLKKLVSVQMNLAAYHDAQIVPQAYNPFIALDFI